MQSKFVNESSLIQTILSITVQGLRFKDEHRYATKIAIYNHYQQLLIQWKLSKNTKAVALLYLITKWDFLFKIYLPIFIAKLP